MAESERYETCGLKPEDLLNLRQFCLDGGEVRELLGIFIRLGILNDAGTVDQECRAFGHSAKAESDLGKEALVGDAVSLCNMMLVIAQQGNGDPFLGRPGCLSKGVVPADPINGAIKGIVGTDALADFTELSGASSREGQRHKEEQDVFLSYFCGKSHLFRPFGSDGGECEVRSLCADGNHGCIKVMEGVE